MNEETLEANEVDFVLNDQEMPMVELIGEDTPLDSVSPPIASSQLELISEPQTSPDQPLLRGIDDSTNDLIETDQLSESTESTNGHVAISEEYMDSTDKSQKLKEEADLIEDNDPEPLSDCAISEEVGIITQVDRAVVEPTVHSVDLNESQLLQELSLSETNVTSDVMSGELRDSTLLPQITIAEESSEFNIPQIPFVIERDENLVKSREPSATKLEEDLTGGPESEELQFDSKEKIEEFVSKPMLTIPRSTHNSTTLLKEQKLDNQKSNLDNNAILTEIGDGIEPPSTDLVGAISVSIATDMNVGNGVGKQDIHFITTEVTVGQNASQINISEERSEVKTIQSEVLKCFGPLLKFIYKINGHLEHLDIGHRLKFSFPTIVAVGMESVGKSKVISRLIGANTQNTEIGPMFLSFNHDRSDFQQQDQYRVEVDFGGHKGMFHSESLEISDQIQHCFQQNKDNHEEPSLKVTISHKYFSCLEVWDLPGISEGYVDPFIEKTNRLSKKLTETVLRDKSNLVLAVIPCTERIRSNPIWKYIQNGDDALKRTIGVLTKIDQVAVFEEATHKVRGDSTDCIPLDCGYIGLSNGSKTESFERQKTKERQLIEQNNPDLLEQSLVGIDSLISKIIRVFKDHFYRSKLEITKDLIQIKAACEIRLHTLGKALNDSNFEEFKSYLLQLYVNDQWETMSTFKVPAFQPHYPTKSIQEAKSQYCWQQDIKQQANAFIRTCGQTYIETWFEKLLSNNTDEYKTYRFRNTLTNYKHLVLKRILTGLDFGDVDNKIESFLTYFLLFKDERNVNKRFIEGTKNIIAMFIYTNIVQKVPIELCKCINSSKALVENLEYSQQRNVLDSILCECKSALELVNDIPEDNTPSIFSNEDQPIQTPLKRYEKVQPIPEALQPIVSEQDKFSLARVRNRVRSEQPRSSGVVTSSSFGYAHEPTVGVRRNRIRRFTTDEEYQDLSNPFVVPNAPLLKPSRLSTRNPALLFRSSKPK